MRSGYLPLCLLRPIGDHAHDLGLCCYVSVNACDPAHLLNTAADAKCNDLEHQRIAWNDRTAKSRTFDTTEERYLFIAVLKLAQREDRADLRQGLDLEN